MSDENISRKAFIVELVELLDRHGAAVDISDEYDGHDRWNGNTISIWSDDFDITVDEKLLDEMRAIRKAKNRRKK